MGLNRHNEINKEALWRSYEVINNFLKSKLNSSKITFFCTGILATEYPDLIRKISDDGHEITCHYYFHDDDCDESLEEFEILKEEISSLKHDAEQFNDNSFRKLTYRVITLRLLSKLISWIV